MSWYEFMKRINLSAYNEEYMNECEVSVTHCYREGVYLEVDLPYKNDPEGAPDVFGTVTRFTKVEAEELILALQEAVTRL